MGEVTGTMIRIPVAIVLFLMFVTGLIGLLRKPAKKKVYIALMVIPLVLVYTMYFSGYIRRAPVTEKNIQEIIEIASAYDYSEYRLEGSVENGVIKVQGYFEGSAENGVIKYQGYFREGSLSDLGRDTIVEELFSRRGTCNDKQYLITYVSSDKGGFWEASCHVGYFGEVFIQLDDGHYLNFSYTIERKIDKYLGFFYAPPLLPIYSFTA
jgi:hypothetical protein